MTKVCFSFHLPPPSFGTNFYFYSNNLKNECVYTHAHTETLTNWDRVGSMPESTPYWLNKLLNFSERKKIFIRTIASIIQDSTQALPPSGVRENDFFFLGTGKKHFHILYIPICSSFLLKFCSTFSK